VVVALSVGWADYAWADTAHSAAEVISKSYENHNDTVWFQEHWGFQYYMEANGHRALDFVRSSPARGDIMVVPSNNTNTSHLQDSKMVMRDVLQFAPHPWLATMNLSAGAGFYTDMSGPLPFAIGSIQPEEYYAVTFEQ
jgi:hypothetical protein